MGRQPQVLPNWQGQQPTENPQLFLLARSPSIPLGVRHLRNPPAEMSRLTDVLDRVAKAPSPLGIAMIADQCQKEG
jgi:hypothetical protein